MGTACEPHASSVGAVSSPATTGGPNQGLLGDYYRGINFESLVATHVDPLIDFLPPKMATLAEQRTGSPHFFSVRWHGQLRARSSAMYTIGITVTGGAHVVLNGQDLTSPCCDPARRSSFLVYAGASLQEGRWYDITLEHQQTDGPSGIQLWSNLPSETRAPIPHEDLRHFR